MIKIKKGVLPSCKYCGDELEVIPEDTKAPIVHYWVSCTNNECVMNINVVHTLDEIFEKLTTINKIHKKA